MGKSVYKIRGSVRCHVHMEADEVTDNSHGAVPVTGVFNFYVTQNLKVFIIPKGKFLGEPVYSPTCGPDSPRANTYSFLLL